ncbi:MAG: 6-carboxytetrahydropterin synthase [Alphaproteobacteria bacterium]|nr:6-carboxytetrahydropterin synthase [Alphaproteobacteria bacterium]
MYELSKQFRFDAAHTLNRNVNNAKEENRSREIHGHSYRAEITLRGEPNPATGMLIDLYQFEKIIEEARDGLEHKFLDDLKDLGPATMENLSAWIWKQLAPKLPMLHSVTVYRDSGSEKCVYFGPKK